MKSEPFHIPVMVSEVVDFLKVVEGGLYIDCTIGGGGHTGCVEILDWNPTVLWHFEYVSKYYRPHNDIEPLPNGNILMTVW